MRTLWCTTTVTLFAVSGSSQRGSASPIADRARVTHGAHQLRRSIGGVHHRCEVPQLPLRPRRPGPLGGGPGARGGAKGSRGGHLGADDRCATTRTRLRPGAAAGSHGGSQVAPPGPWDPAATGRPLTDRSQPGRPSRWTPFPCAGCSRASTRGRRRVHHRGDAACRGMGTASVRCPSCARIGAGPHARPRG